MQKKSVFIIHAFLVLVIGVLMSAMPSSAKGPAGSSSGDGSKI